MTVTDDKTHKRTLQQNKAMHKYFELLAEALNDAGLDMKTVLKPAIEIPWTKESVKNHLWRPVQQIMMDIESTADISTIDPTVIKQVIDRHLADNHGFIGPEWPSLR